MKKIIISPYSRKMRTQEQVVNPKNYPYWKEVVSMLKAKDCFVTQVGIRGEEKIEGVDDFIIGASLDKLSIMVKEYDTWCSVDNFFQHLAHLQEKPGVVIFGQSDPLIFGHPENKNLLKDRSYLREKQFDIWEAVKFNANAFITPEVVVDALLL